MLLAMLLAVVCATARSADAPAVATSGPLPGIPDDAPSDAPTRTGTDAPIGSASDPQQDPAQRDRLLDAIRAIMAGDRYPTLVSVDADGQPRARTVEVSVPDPDMTLWVATRPNTRKVAQLRAAPRATLHYAVDAEGSYVSVMGTATLHDDAETIARHRFQTDASLAAFWPDFPEDYLLIRIRPEWIEVLGAGVEADPDDWRPQMIRFADADSDADSDSVEKNDAGRSGD